MALAQRAALARGAALRQAAVVGVIAALVACGGAVVAARSWPWALLAALAAASAAAVTYSRGRRTAAALRRATYAERRTARQLRRLPHGWTVVHDRRLPDQRANLDHVVVGPPGVFLLDTKLLRGVLQVGPTTMRIGERPLNQQVDLTRRQAEALRRWIGSPLAGTPVRPVWVVWNTPVPRGARASGVRIVSGEALVKMLLRSSRALDLESVHATAHRLRQLPRARW